MKLYNIEKFTNKMKSYRDDWIYSDTQINLMNVIKEVNPYDLASKLARKYLERKKKPGVDEIEDIAKTLLLFDEDKEDICSKCRRGYISVFNHKEWWFDEEINNYRSYSTWTPDNLQNIFLIPKMEIACDCRNVKKDHTMKIHSYLKWMSDYSYKAPRLFEICYIQLYIFVNHILQIDIPLSEFDPYSFWSVHNIDSPALLSFDDIKDQHIKELFVEVFFTKEKAKIKDVKLKRIEDVIL